MGTALGNGVGYKKKGEGGGKGGVWGSDGVCGVWGGVGERVGVRVTANPFDFHLSRVDPREHPQRKTLLVKMNKQEQPGYF